MSTRMFLPLAALSLSACAQMAAAFKPKPPAPNVPPAPPITAELHRANLGKIVFATAEIEKDAQTAPLIQQATLGDTVEVRAYFTTTGAQTLLAKSGKECDYQGIELQWEMRDARDATWLPLSTLRPGRPLLETWTTTRIDPLWGPKQTWPNIDSQDQAISKFLQSKQSAGPIPFEVRVNVSCELKDNSGSVVSATLAQGGLTVTLDPSSVDAHIARTFGTLPHEFAHAGDFKIIETEARRAWGTDDAKILWVRVPQREWTIVRGDLGEIRYRGATVTTAIRKGDQCAIKTAIAREDYVGGGRFVDVPKLADARAEFPETTEMPCSVL